MSEHEEEHGSNYVDHPDLSTRDKEFIEKITQEIVDKTITAFMESKGAACRCSVDMQTHIEHHRSYANLLKVLDKIDGLKWSLAKNVLGTIIAVAILGGAAFFWRHHNG